MTILTNKYAFLIKIRNIKEIVLILPVQYTPDYAIQSFNKDLMRANYVPETLPGSMEQ